MIGGYLLKGTLNRSPTIVRSTSLLLMVESFTSLLSFGGYEFLIIFVVVALSYRYTSSRLRLPPGPTPLPILGNIHQIPVASPEEGFARWRQKYGDVIHLSILRSSLIVLNSLDSARDLLEKKSAIYSDRPRFVLLNELMGWHNASTHVRYGPRFRKHRRFIHQTFNQQAALSLRPVQEKETLNLVRGFVDTPEQFAQHIRRFAAATIMKITYGRDITSVSDEFVLLAERAGSLTVQSGTPAASLVDFFPIMKHIPTWAPLAGFKRNARVVKEAVDRMMNIPFEMVKDQMVSGTANPCLTSRLLEACGETASFEDEEDIKGVAGTMYAAAEDTTVCVLVTFVLAMVLHPQNFKKAQEEMDKVIGVNRVPSIEDRGDLPYLECVLKEVYRWNPAAPLGIPHRLMEADVYNEHYIPEGSTVVANIYAMLQECSNPRQFHPERHLKGDLIDPQELVFGFGRRRCPGRYFADTGVWLVAANLVASVNISKAKNELGEEINPEVAFTPGFIRHPKPFPCQITARA
ncbi:cytochrome P450 [Dendrothele bispora CBS 962.96]|uniref:Cytochrome P450 n=1 Tax=Dendrothele bispora (strain CBS 962.96) TaxID=1314807 RepID=A0A4S8MI11_DENBC|nr:cytochrome P450 [Dendrothele bispora CBS 962.96]